MANVQLAYGEANLALTQIYCHLQCLFCQHLSQTYLYVCLSVVLYVYDIRLHMFGLFG